MARRGRLPKSPCGCRVDGQWRIVVGGIAPPPHWLWGTRFSPEDIYLETPAYDRTLRLWFLPEAYVLPDPDRDALICLVCDEPTGGMIGFGDGLDEVETCREQAGLNPEWHFEWIQ